MKIRFTKMHGAGNDFMVIDDRELTFPAADAAYIADIASRRTGVGCEGIILLQPSDTADLRMRFFNPDGNEVDMCGNGARCFARRAYELGAAPAEMQVQTGAGLVRAAVRDGAVTLELTAPEGLQLDRALDGVPWPVDSVNTGVPHVVCWVEDPGSVDVVRWGSMIRHHEGFAPGGTNANFARVEPDGTLTVRTYERGVEAETMACGTGAAAVAVLAAERKWVSLPATVHCASGYDLLIDSALGICILTGNAEKVFDGEIWYGNRL